MKIHCLYLKGSQSILAILFLLFGFQSSLSAQSYSTVRINKQEWMQINLSTRVFRNGDSIPLAKSKDAWRNAEMSKSPMCCYLEGDSILNSEMGLLYNWYAVNDERGLAPEGFRIPSIADFQILLNQFESNEIACIRLKDATWTSDISQLTGFNAKATGFRFYKGMYDSKGYITGFWAKESASNEFSALSFMLTASCIIQEPIGPAIKGAGFSVRCIK
jgi:uncharacterized protein (TIGR02145 family)